MKKPAHHVLAAGVALGVALSHAQTLQESGGAWSRLLRLTR